MASSHTQTSPNPTLVHGTMRARISRFWTGIQANHVQQKLEQYGLAMKESCGCHERRKLPDVYHYLQHLGCMIDVEQVRNHLWEHYLRHQEFFNQAFQEFRSFEGENINDIVLAALDHTPGNVVEEIVLFLVASLFQIHVLVITNNTQRFWKSHEGTTPVYAELIFVRVQTSQGAKIFPCSGTNAQPKGLIYGTTPHRVYARQTSSLMVQGPLSDPNSAIAQILNIPVQSVTSTMSQALTAPAGQEAAKKAETSGTAKVETVTIKPQPLDSDIEEVPIPSPHTVKLQEALDAQSEDFHLQLAALQEEIADLQQSVTTLEKKTSEMENNNTKLKEENTKLSDENDVLMGENDRLAEHLQSMVKTEEDMEEIKNREEQQTVLKHDNEILAQENWELRKFIAGSEVKLDDALDENDRSQKKIDQLNREAEENKKITEAYKAENEELHKTVKETEEAADICRTAFKSAEETRRTAIRQCGDALRAKNRAEETTSTLQTENKRLQAALSGARRTSQQTGGSSGRNEENARLQQELNAALDRIQALEDENKNLKKESDDLQSEVTRKSKLDKKAIEDREDLVSKMKAGEDREGILQLKLRNIEEEHSKQMENEQTKAETLLKDIKAQLHAAKIDIDHLRVKVSAGTEEIDGLRENLGKQVHVTNKLQHLVTMIAENRNAMCAEVEDLSDQRNFLCHTLQEQTETMEKIRADCVKINNSYVHQVMKRKLQNVIMQVALNQVRGKPPMHGLSDTEIQTYENTGAEVVVPVVAVPTLVRPTPEFTLPDMNKFTEGCDEARRAARGAPTVENILSLLPLEIQWPSSVSRMVEPAPCLILSVEEMQKMKGDNAQSKGGEDETHEDPGADTHEYPEDMTHEEPEQTAEQLPRPTTPMPSENKDETPRVVEVPPCQRTLRDRTAMKKQQTATASQGTSSGSTPSDAGVKGTGKKPPIAPSSEQRRNPKRGVKRTSPSTTSPEPKQKKARKGRTTATPTRKEETRSTRSQRRSSQSPSPSPASTPSKSKFGGKHAAMKVLCPYCKKIFGSGVLGDAHIMEKHPDQDGVICPRDNCGKYISRYADMKRHLEQGHKETSDLYPYHTVVPTREGASLAEVTEEDAADAAADAAADTTEGREEERPGTEQATSSTTDKSIVVTEQHQERKQQTQDSDTDSSAPSHVSSVDAEAEARRQARKKRQKAEKKLEREQQASPASEAPTQGQLSDDDSSSDAGEPEEPTDKAPSALNILGDIASAQMKMPTPVKRTKSYDIHTTVKVSTTDKSETISATIERHTEPVIDLGGTTTAHAEAPAQSEPRTGTAAKSSTVGDTQGSDRDAEDATLTPAAQPAKVPVVPGELPVPTAEEVAQPTPAAQEAGTTAEEAVATQAGTQDPSKA